MKHPLDDVKAFQRRERQKRKAGRSSSPDSGPRSEWTCPGRDGDAWVIAARDPAGKMRTLAHVYSTEAKDLMVAAPDLLAACRLMYRAWEELMPNLAKGVVQDYHLVLTEAPCACKAAIAKATGDVLRMP